MLHRGVNSPARVAERSDSSTPFLFLTPPGEALWPDLCHLVMSNLQREREFLPCDLTRGQVPGCDSDTLSCISVSPATSLVCLWGRVNDGHDQRRQAAGRLYHEGFSRHVPGRWNSTSFHQAPRSHSIQASPTHARRTLTVTVRNLLSVILGVSLEFFLFGRTAWLVEMHVTRTRSCSQSDSADMSSGPERQQAGHTFAFEAQRCPALHSWPCSSS